MIEVKDQMNRIIRSEKIPQRIISLVPSQTELLYELGLGDRVVGITKFCIHPDIWFKNKTRIGGTKNVNHALIAQLNPDLIIGNKEENSEADIDKLGSKYTIYMSDIYTHEDALEMIADVGKITRTEEKADQLIQNIRSEFSHFPSLPKSVLYLIWANPYMAAGSNTFIGDILNKLKLTNCITDSSARYLEVTAQDIANLKPDFIFLSSEPFPFKDLHAQELQKFSGSKIIFVDGEMFSWYGSRMIKMKAYFTELFQHLKGNQP